MLPPQIKLMFLHADTVPIEMYLSARYTPIISIFLELKLYPVFGMVSHAKFISMALSWHVAHGSALSVMQFISFGGGGKWAVTHQHSHFMFKIK